MRQLLTMAGIFVVAIYVTFTFMLPSDGVAHPSTASTTPSHYQALTLDFPKK